MGNTGKKREIQKTDDVVFTPPGCSIPYKIPPTTHLLLQLCTLTKGWSPKTKFSGLLLVIPRDSACEVHAWRLNKT